MAGDSWSNNNEDSEMIKTLNLELVIILLLNSWERDTSNEVALGEEVKNDRGQWNE